MDIFGDSPETQSSTSTGDESHSLQKSKTSHPEKAARPLTKVDRLFEDLPPTQGQGQQTVSNNECGKRKSSEQSEDCDTKRLASDILQIKGYAAERKGERTEMQDAHTLIDDFKSTVPQVHQSINRLAYYGVFDGHAGTRASRYAAQHVHQHLAEKFPSGNIAKVETDIKKCFIETFKKTDEDFLKEASKAKPAWKDGSTAATVTVINNTVYIANIGDSKAVLCRYSVEIQKHTAIPLSKDHSPTLYEERMRIQKARGHVKDGRLMGVLEVSRSIGDGPYKKHGMSCIPDVKRCQLKENDRFIIIACDGLWKSFTNDSAITFLNRILEDKSILGTDTKNAETVRWETACSKLANEAVRRLSADNVTVILVAIGTPR